MKLRQEHVQKHFASLRIGREILDAAQLTIEQGRLRHDDVDFANASAAIGKKRLKIGRIVGANSHIRLFPHVQSGQIFALLHLRGGGERGGQQHCFFSRLSWLYLSHVARKENAVFGFFHRLHVERREVGLDFQYFLVGIDRFFVLERNLFGDNGCIGNEIRRIILTFPDRRSASVANSSRSMKPSRFRS